jgi:hypothetical protein
MVVTSWHVVNDILLARKSSTPHDHTEVFINFNYEKNGRPPSSGHKLRPLSYEFNVICESFDYAFLTLEDCVEEKLTLGKFVRCKVPEQGKVCIVGHPGGDEKQDELCLILPVHEDRRSLEIERRLAETEQRYQPSASTFYMYRSNIRKLHGDRTALTYDVGGMFEGSSGAPVLDMKCNIVALHTLGFRLGDTSIVEVGVTFRAIIQNLEASGHSDFVREYFPKCWDNDEDMDENEAMDEDEVEEEDMDDDIFGILSGIQLILLRLSLEGHNLKARKSTMDVSIMMRLFMHALYSYVLLIKYVIQLNSDKGVEHVPH